MPIFSNHPNRLLITKDYLDIFFITHGRKAIDLSRWKNVKAIKETSIPCAFEAHIIEIKTRTKRETPPFYLLANK